MTPAKWSRRELEDLKIEALARGVRVSEDVLQRLGGGSALTVHEYSTTGGLPLKVAGLDVNVPFDEWYCQRSALKLVIDGGVPRLAHGDRVFDVDVVYPLPSYVGATLVSGGRVDELVFSHLDRFRLSPISGCAYDCAFCDMPGRVRLWSAAQLLEAAEVAMADPALPPRHALVSGGTPGPRDEEAFADTLVEVVSALSSRIEVDVMMASTSYGPDLVARLVDAGVHGFALNLELESDGASRVHIRGKHRRSRPWFDATVAAAVSLLGKNGRVRSLILPGLESVENTLAGVEHIAELGADPVLSPFRPAQGTTLAASDPVSPTLLREVLDGSREIVARHGVSLGPRCAPCQHNTLAFPWDVNHGP